MAKPRTLGVYKSYNFRSKDPILTIVENTIKREELSNKEVSENSGVSEGTLYQWFYGKTRKPQFATVAAVMMSMGYSCTWTKANRNSLTVKGEK